MFNYFTDTKDLDSKSKLIKSEAEVLQEVRNKMLFEDTMENYQENIEEKFIDK